MPRLRRRWIASRNTVPPTPSITVSKRPASSSRAVTTAWAPSARAAPARCSPLTSAVTCAPPATASCTANEPTPPVAPVTSTRRPSRSPPSRSARRAVSPATGSAAASSNETASGNGGEPMTGQDGLLGPAAAVGRSGNTRPRRRAAAVRGLARDHAGEILARAPPVRPGLSRFNSPRLIAYARTSTSVS